jgi:hypothetical protein
VDHQFPLAILRILISRHIFHITKLAYFINLEQIED